MTFLHERLYNRLIGRRFNLVNKLTRRLRRGNSLWVLARCHQLCV